ncbi:putative MFS transporter [Aspergillus phoenicis ATCC 13157]|uniref:Putative MFS transporter n=1 Tax=Aspergillus phoenicis ATCC 13157 TaxID=1353007 RepID=A0A370P873_ASPPH|nr:putative MFS transporter [Aspergillus phoenicis ATCC 13157]
MVSADAEDTKQGVALPPEEGVQGWICVVGSCLSLFCTYGFLSAIGVFQTVYEETTLKEYSPSDISWIFTVELCLMWALGPIYGRILDTYGPAPVLYPCSFLCVLSLCMTSLAHEYYQIFLAQGLTFGLGAGGVFTTASVCVGQWFIRRRALAMGIATCGASLGGVVFPLFLEKVIKIVGFHGAVRYTALFIGILLALACLMVRARLPQRKWDREARWFDFAVFKQKQPLLFVIGCFFAMWSMWGPYDYLSTMAKNSGLSSSLSVYLISMITAASVPGRLIPSYLADRIGHHNVLTACAFFSGTSIFCLWLPFNYHHSEVGIIVFALFYGFASGSIVSLFMPCIAKFGKIESLGQIFGTFQLVISISCLTGLPIMGGILNQQHRTDFSGLQIFAGLSAILGSLFLGTSNYLLAKSRRTWKV